jgi:hypothetical protein
MGYSELQRAKNSERIYLSHLVVATLYESSIQWFIVEQCLRY